MLVHGTANPTGLDHNQYSGVYLTDRDIDNIVPFMRGVPVKIEHKGGDIGHVVSAWKNNGRMDLVLEINNHTLEGAFGKQFVEKGVCKDLSLGYKVEMSKALDGSLRASNKRVMEVSLVREGARPNCQIHQFAPSHRIIV